jgi:serine/threonine-protein kinase
MVSERDTGAHTQTGGDVGVGFAERYRLRGTPSRSAIAELDIAEDRTIGRDVVLQVRFTGGDDARLRFLREARVQAQLEHPAVVPIYDIGVDPKQREFFTARNVRGKTLRSVLEKLAQRDPATSRSFTRDRLLGVFRQVCLAVDYAHSCGVVHRDLKPEHVVLGDFGEVYLTGWSVVKLLPHAAAVDGVGTATLTLGGEVVGTLGYAAPEQLLSPQEVDERADVYALGAILFELLTLQPLHTERTREALVAAMGRDIGLSARAQACSVPRELELACLRATTLSASTRIASARELCNSIEDWLAIDRDADALAELAKRHAELAEEAAVRALVSKDGGHEHRRMALREAGRALALDPEAEGARRALVALLREPPPHPPPEAQDAFEAQQGRELQKHARYWAVAFGAFTLLLGSVTFSGVLRWGWFLLIVGALLTAMAASLWLATANKPRTFMLVIAFTASSFAVASACGMYGPLILVPALAVANTLALNTSLFQSYRWLALLLGCAAVCVPYALERSGVLPPSYVFDARTITVMPIIRGLPEVPIRIALLASSLVTLIAATLIIWRRSSDLDGLRERLYLNTWQLARLLPESARAQIFSRGAD